MAPTSLTIGTAYYRLTFADPARTIPGVRPMIYIGANVFPDDDPNVPVHYFQDTVSYRIIGSVASPGVDERRSDVEPEVFPHTEPDLSTSIMTLEEIVTALADALRRASWRH